MKDSAEVIMSYEVFKVGNKGFMYENDLKFHSWFNKKLKSIAISHQTSSSLYETFQIDFGAAL